MAGTVALSTSYSMIAMILYVHTVAIPVPVCSLRTVPQYDTIYRERRTCFLRCMTHHLNREDRQELTSSAKIRPAKIEEESLPSVRETHSPTIVF
jgi:hypothetical protein